MRTTLTLDDDVAVALTQRKEKNGLSFKEVVNETLRAGLAVRRPHKKQQSPPTTPLHVARVRVPSLDCTAELLSFAEGEEFK